MIFYRAIHSFCIVVRIMSVIAVVIVFYSGICRSVSVWSGVCVDTESVALKLNVFVATCDKNGEVFVCSEAFAVKIIIKDPGKRTCK